MPLKHIYVNNVDLAKTSNISNIVKTKLTNTIKPYKEKLDPTSPDFLSSNWISWSSPQDFLAQFSEWGVLDHFRSFILFLLPKLPVELPFLVGFFTIFFIVVAIIVAGVKYRYMLLICLARDNELSLLLNMVPVPRLFPSKNYKRTGMQSTMISAHFLSYLLPVLCDTL